MLELLLSVNFLLSSSVLLADPHVWVRGMARGHLYGHVGAAHSVLIRRVQAFVVKVIYLAVEVTHGVIVRVHRCSMPGVSLSVCIALRFAVPRILNYVTNFP